MPYIFVIETRHTPLQSNDIVVADDDPIGRGGGTALVCLDTVFCNGLDGVTELGIESDNTNCNQQMPNFSMMMSTNSAVWPNSLDGSCLAMNWLTMKKANMRIKVFRSSS